MFKQWTMKRRRLLLLTLVILVYPVYKAIDAGLILFGEEEEVAAVTQSITAFQLSIWILWVILVSISVYFKWIAKRNLFFYITYGLIILGFGLYGFYTQKAVNLYDLPSRFEDRYTLGVFMALQQVAVAGILTFFIQFSVWIFKSKWHRN